MWRSEASPRPCALRRDDGHGRDGDVDPLPELEAVLGGVLQAHEGSVIGAHEGAAEAAEERPGSTGQGGG